MINLFIEFQCQTNRAYLYWRRCWPWCKRWWGRRHRWWRRPGRERGRRRWRHAHSPPHSRTGTSGRKPRPGVGIAWPSQRRRTSRRLHSFPSTSWIPGIIYYTVIVIELQTIVFILLINCFTHAHQLRGFLEMYMYIYRFIIIDLQTILFNLLILWSNSFPSVSWIVGWPSILLQTILFILLRYDFTYTLTCRQFCLFYLHIVSLITINFIQSWKYRYHNTCITNLQTILLILCGLTVTPLLHRFLVL